MLSHRKSDQVEADGAPFLLWPLVATRHQTPLKISCGGQVGRIGSSCISRILGHNTLIYDEWMRNDAASSLICDRSRPPSAAFVSKAGSTGSRNIEGGAIGNKPCKSESRFEDSGDSIKLPLRARTESEHGQNPGRQRLEGTRKETTADRRHPSEKDSVVVGGFEVEEKVRV